MNKVIYEVKDGVALIAISNPPVNGCSHAVRLGIAEGLNRANEDSGVVAIVLTGDGASFSAGADIREFGSPQMIADPSLADLADLLENNEKPVVAAISGNCLGGGLELALGCHYRVASSSAVLGLPEVKLGLLPGGGGTQRLPRLVGLEIATNMIVSGEPVPAKQLQMAGAFDHFAAEGELLESAISFARKVSDVRPLPRVSGRIIKHPNADGYLNSMRLSVQSMAAAYPAPRKCVEAVRAAVEKPFTEGIATERRLFSELLLSPESDSLRHFFFAEREASRIKSIPPDTQPREIRRVGVIGAGTMGGGIAMNFLNAGIPVTILEMKQDALDRGIGLIRTNYMSSVRKGKLKEDKFEQRMALLHTTLSYDDLADCDLVIEAVFEEMGVKEAVFRTLDKVVKQGAILATNTSTLNVDRIAEFTGRPGDVLGLHFFSPANVMKLLEVVRGAKTSPDVLVTAMTIAKKIRKVAVVSGVCDGFIGNRMIGPYGLVAGLLLEAGASPQQIDRALENFGFAMGPFRMGDMAGNDIGWAVRKRMKAEDPSLQYPELADRLCEAGRFGQKTGKGWYLYPDGRKAVVDPEVEAMIETYRTQKGIVVREFSDEEIVQRCVFALVNEGAKLLGEGIAERASDIDIVYIYGYGFPVYRGGPMHFASRFGIHKVLQSMRRYQGEGFGDPRLWQPAELLLTLAKEGKSFSKNSF